MYVLKPTVPLLVIQVFLGENPGKIWGIIAIVYPPCRCLNLTFLAYGILRVFWSSFSLSYTLKYLHIPTNLRNFVEKGWSRWFNLRQLRNCIRALWLRWEWGEHTIWGRKAKFSQQSKYQEFPSYFLTQWFCEEFL